MMNERGKGRRIKKIVRKYGSYSKEEVKREEF